MTEQRVRNRAMEIIETVEEEQINSLIDETKKDNKKLGFEEAARVIAGYYFIDIEADVIENEQGTYNIKIMGDL